MLEVNTSDVDADEVLEEPVCIRMFPSSFRLTVVQNCLMMASTKCSRVCSKIKLTASIPLKGPASGNVPLKLTSESNSAPDDSASSSSASLSLSICITQISASVIIGAGARFGAVENPGFWLISAGDVLVPRFVNEKSGNRPEHGSLDVSDDAKGVELGTLGLATSIDVP